MLYAFAIGVTVVVAAVLLGVAGGGLWYRLSARPGKGWRPELWRRATYRTPAQPHPDADAGLRTLRQRRPQDDLEGWR